MFLRFHPAGELDIDVMLSRDTESRYRLRKKQLLMPGLLLILLFTL
jgi:hypothetical protein